MRSLISYILLFALLLTTVSPWGTMAYYHLNKDYIARVLCENRLKPQLHCDGQCYLAKRLRQQQDKQDKETSERVRQTVSIQLFCNDPLHIVFPVPTAPDQKPVFTYLNRAYAAPVPGLLKPPCRLFVV